MALHLESKLAAAGFHKLTARTFERNVLYDTPDRNLRNNGQTLRMQKCGPSG